MSTFSYAQYQNSINSAQNRQNSSVKVGWFKLTNDGDTAIVRLNVHSLEDLQFATIHQLSAAANWMKVSCLNAFGSSTDTCPLCRANAAGNTAIGKAANRVYVQMLVSYRDNMTGTYSAPIPVVWDKPAGFSREIANKLRDYGDLTKALLKITRNGAKGDLKTTYSMEYAVPTVFKNEMIPEDFSAFNNFRADKHSFWSKSVEECNTFLTTGAFPEVVKQETPVVQTVAQTAQTNAGGYVNPTQSAPVNNTYTGYQTPVTPQPQQQAHTTPTQEEPKPAPANKFSGFSF